MYSLLLKTKIGDKTLTYVELNRLESITYTINNAHYLCSYVYNYKGELVKKEIIKTNSDTITEWKVIDFYVHNGIILGEDVNDLLDDSIDKYRYFYDKEGITAMQYNDSIYNFVKDALGNVTKVIH